MKLSKKQPLFAKKFSGRFYYRSLVFWGAESESGVIEQHFLDRFEIFVKSIFHHNFKSMCRFDSL